MSEVGIYEPNDTPGILLTDNAKAHILTYLKKEGVSAVRFSVKKAGCSGMAYVIDYLDAPLENDIVLTIDEGYELYIDKASYPYLKGMTVDYVKQGLNKRFEFINPNQKGVCGCGESFTV